MNVVLYMDKGEKRYLYFFGNGSACRGICGLYLNEVKNREFGLYPVIQ